MRKINIKELLMKFKAFILKVLRLVGAFITLLAALITIADKWM
ncbi:hypothetical protein ACQKND_16340 [Viridibacillus arvi]